ncbi:Serine/threonine-protein phosphatase C23G10.1 [Caenorhabditis elegans]|uniref:Serine/threonine-protein phosphatase C23G10.1 n=1 Tax=Caenorhabditis elegans TaxID=6239 RepID=YSD1_CAEEL|nr:Serine/threonine-protein phosphatase C23G10.1 [Caenorhabditis elegans]P48459.3 RecName: Full=Serine/threonine-protein phosphatase C23G10.1 [Caenorhabditis elegans]CCD65293.2 Serine/threonine-protein phosphatase C23G10.1 [Caenorhabditis elegans]
MSKKTRVPEVADDCTKTVYPDPIPMPTCPQLINDGTSCFLNIILQMLKRANFHDHFKGDWQKGKQKMLMHKELQQIFNGKPGPKDVSRLREMFSNEALKDGPHPLLVALKCLIKMSAVSDNDVIKEKGARDKMFQKQSDESNKMFAEHFIKTLLACKGMTKIRTMDIFRLIHICKKIFTVQKSMVEIDGPVRICGDLHGQYPDLIRLFAQGGFPPDSNYLFLGDYVDRGSFNLEVILLCLAYKARYPNNFMMLRGNHEVIHINEKYGFKDEVFNRKGEYHDELYPEFNEMMDMMPLVALVGGRILCMHGGLSQHIKSLDDLRNLRRPFHSEDECLENDIMWSDPAKVSGWTANPRGASVQFGENEVKEMCKLLDIDLIVRGHQVVQDGYEFFAGKKLVTVFSAPHYMQSFTNSAAVCKVSAGLEVSFEVLKPEDIRVEEIKCSAESSCASDMQQ